MRVSVEQMKCQVGEINTNLEKIMGKIDEAAKRGEDLVVFPEMSLSGYSLIRKQMNQSLRQQLERALEKIRRISGERKIDVIISFPEIGREEVYITAVYIEGGEEVGRHRKVYLADYLHAVEHLHFDPGESFNVFSTRHGRVGLLICEDAWHLSSSIILGQDRPDIIIAPSATSITSLEKLYEIQMRWEVLSRAIAMTQAVYFIYCNQSGEEDKLTFWGGSHVVSPYGEILNRLPSMEEGSGRWDLDMNYVAQCKRALPLVEKEKNTVNLREFGRIVDAGEAE